MRALRASTPLALSLCCAAGLAQAPSPWSALTLPGGAGGTATADGKLVLYRDGTFLRVFSAVTNQWHAHVPSFGTYTVLTKDLLLVPESDRWTAFSAYRGVFETQFVNLAASTIETSDSLARVIEGTTLYVFSAFTGRWHSRTIPSGALVTLANRIAIVRTPNGAPSPLAAAFDAYTGQWHDLPVVTAGGAIAGGTALFASPTHLYGFSPLRPGWVPAAVAPASPSPFMPLSSFDGNLRGLRGAVFSAITATFAPPPPSASTAFWLGSNVAHNGNGSQWFVLGAARNTWTPLPAGATQAGSLDQVAWGSGNGEVHAYSQIHDTVATIPWPATAFGTGPTGRGHVVTVSDVASGAQRIFSAFTAQWHTPPGTVGGPWADDNSAIYLTPTGAVAFAARTGTFVPLAAAGLVRHSGFAASTATHLHVFDARTERWSSEPFQLGAGTGPIVGTRTLLGVEPGRALAYAVRGGRLVAQPLASGVTDLRAEEDVAYVRTATHLYAFGGLAGTTTWQDGPDGWYGVGLGTRVDVQARLPAGHVVAFGLGPQLQTPVALPPFGELLVDPAAATIVTFAAVPGEVRAVTSLQIPNVAALQGTTWVQQTITVPPAGTPWLGAPSTFVVQ